MHRYLLLLLISLLPSVSLGQNSGGKLLSGEKVTDTVSPGQNPVRHRCLTPEGNPDKLGGLRRATQWSLPSVSLPIDFDTTIHCLVLRFNFQYEDPDDPNTTGRGRMDLSRPLDTLTDEEYIAREGYLIDPPPHDSLYFDAHLRALNHYWEKVSEGRLHLTWDVYPPYSDSVYTLPQPMSYYGKCDFEDVVGGLENYFTDCIRLADTAHVLRPGDSAAWNIDFSQYQAFFLFHAGADRQSDIGFPVTCNDLFSGFIRFGGSVPVDDSTVFVNTALLMPETVVQDNRVSALNALIAHEFGHQLGLIDVYDTRNFMTQLGDFALMDNNGFGTGIDFAGFNIGKVFGTMPVYPCAWSRAFLGFVDVVDIREDTADVAIVAAAVPGDSLTKVVRIPISETEYYLLENRVIEVDGRETFVLADSATSVIMGPSTQNRELTGEYDILSPGSGMMITLIDEEIAALDYDGDGQNNFDDNDLQWWLPSQRRKFITLIEADGRTGFGGYFRQGFGSAEDLYRDDRNNALTPNTNPPAFDNTGSNTHVYVTDIRRDTVLGAPQTTYDDRVIRFDFELDRRVPGFPVRAGLPQIPIGPIADDLDGDGSPEVIAVAGNLLSVVTSDGENFIRTVSTCDTLACPLYYDTAYTSVNRGVWYNPASAYPVPVYAEAPDIITAGPVTGDFGTGSGTKYVAIGYQNGLTSEVAILAPTDGDSDARADHARIPLSITSGTPIALAFSDALFILTNANRVYRLDSLNASLELLMLVEGSMFHGVAMLQDRFVVISGDSTTTRINVYGEELDVYSLSGMYNFGPLVVDLNRDGMQEVVLFDADGRGVFVSVNTVPPVVSFSVLFQRATGHPVTTNPVAGDVDGDGYAEVIIGGRGHVYAYDANFITKTDFPLEVDDRFPDSSVIAAPIIADVARGGMPELMFPTSSDNLYAYGLDRAFGFPLSTGRQRSGVSGASPVVFHDDDGGKLAILGGDGWLYAWEVDADSVRDFWPMTGGGPDGSFALATSKLSDPAPSASAFDENQFYNYPNPVEGSSTIIRYFLNGVVNRVTLNFFDLSGVKVDELAGTTLQDATNEVEWVCGDVLPGVYRCIIKVEYPDETVTAFTDIAKVR